MSLENADILAQRLIEEPTGVAVAEAQYNPDVKSIFTKAYKYAQDVLGSTSKRVSNFIGFYSDWLKYNIKEDHTVPYAQKQKGFTLTELLVTISATGLLMAILLPSLQRARSGAKSIGCQSNERQWGVAFAADEETSSNLLERFQPFLSRHQEYKNMKGNSLRSDANDIYLCPAAKKLGSPVPSLAPPYLPLLAWDGSKFSAWGYKFENEFFTSSYSVNTNQEYISGKNPNPTKNMANLPILFDSTFRLTGLTSSDDSPPLYDDMPRSIAEPEKTRGCVVAINRHSGFVNHLFKDSSVRKVGLKELWTLKWNEEFNTAGPWVKAGGVQPEDWPEWMRGFKDY